MDDALELLRYDHDELEELFGQVSDPEADRVEMLGKLAQRLAAHISAEQSLLVPLLKRNRIGGRKLIRRLRADSRRISGLLLRIERRKGNSPDLPELVTDLLDAYHAHTRLFEAAVTPGLRNRVSDEDMKGLLEKIESAESVILSHPHPHLLSLGPLSRLTTRMAAIFDKARDKTPPVAGLREQNQSMTRERR